MGSNNATLAPDLAAATAAITPLGVPPKTTTSNLGVMPWLGEGKRDGVAAGLAVTFGVAVGGFMLAGLATFAEGVGAV